MQADSREDTTIVEARDTDKQPETPGKNFTKTTTYEYDLQQWYEAFKSHLRAIGLVAVMHLYFKLPNPLLIQSVLPLINILESSLVRIHVLGQRPEGELQRPWDSKPGLFSFVAQTLPIRSKSGRAREREKDDLSSD